MVSKTPLSYIFYLFIIAITATSCSSQHTKQRTTQTTTPSKSVIKQTPPKKTIIKKPPSRISPFAKRLSRAAKERTKHHVVYDGSYKRIGYPWGDVAPNIGVCTDVVIRSYRRLGIDLQQQVHRDMQQSFNAYPNLSKWKLKRPDSNIDHRRVYNLQEFFKRHGQTLPITRNPNHYQPGDLVTWELSPGVGHIGIVVEQRSKQDPRRHLIVHNIAQGPKMEDILFRFRISGHYRYTGNMKYIQPTVYAKNNHVKGLGTIPPELLR